MQLPINIQELFTGRVVEWERLEFKEGWKPESVLHSVCAFANDFHNWGGGYLVIGVAEKDGQPVLPPKGLAPEQVDAIQKKLLELGNHAIQPAYHPLMVPATVDGRQVLVLWVPGGHTRPYKAKLSLAKDAKEWAYYIRKGSTTVQARGADERELLSLAATVPFDDRRHQSARLDELSRDLILGFLQQIGSDLAKPAETMPLAKLGRQMNIVDGPEESPSPRNVGLLFFHPEPHRFFPQTQIDVVWFPQGAGGDQFEEKTFRGPLGRMVREALDYIRRNYLKETVIKRPDRAEVTRVANFPYAAVEEALVNAIYHRSYEEREPVEVRISPEELAVLSFPGPDRSIALADLRCGKAVSRRYRNRRIGEFLKELDLTEGRATGIPKILRAMRDNGSPMPGFETDEDRTSFLIRLPVHPKARDVVGTTHDTTQVGLDVNAFESKALQELAKALGVATTQVTTQVATQVGRLLNTAMADARTRQELQTAAGMANREHFRKFYIEPLVVAGWLAPTIPEKPTSRLQKYRLTDAARTWLASLTATKTTL